MDGVLYGLLFCCLVCPHQDKEDTTGDDCMGRQQHGEAVCVFIYIKVQEDFQCFRGRYRETVAYITSKSMCYV